ncbi:MAG: CsbD family protein [Oscillatoria sp. PMC 1068.18]|nr:CsbD family protein [Oscillatoria sp. PMC 1076.18]MEC4988549.1 CsbD family protein [Oscillatoria sp. PMC 1068.18]
MTAEDRIKATAKNLEGKVQEAVGELSGNERQKVEGKVKQMQAKAMHEQENLKDDAKNIIDRA